MCGVIGAFLGLTYFIINYLAYKFFMSNPGLKLKPTKIKAIDKWLKFVAHTCKTYKAGAEYEINVSRKSIYVYFVVLVFYIVVVIYL